jgi:hypothetical protein
VLKTARDPRGWHSWLEVGGWAIDAAHGGRRPILIMPTSIYYDVVRIAGVREIGING